MIWCELWSCFVTFNKIWWCITHEEVTPCWHHNGRLNLDSSIQKVIATHVVNNVNTIFSVCDIYCIAIHVIQQHLAMPLQTY